MTTELCSQQRSNQKYQIPGGPTSARNVIEKATRNTVLQICMYMLFFNLQCQFCIKYITTH